MNRAMHSLLLHDSGPRIPPAPKLVQVLTEEVRRVVVHPREFSNNWSGAVILPLTKGGRFDSIGAAWTVPNAMPPRRQALHSR